MFSDWNKIYFLNKRNYFVQYVWNKKELWKYFNINKNFLTKVLYYWFDYKVFHYLLYILYKKYNFKLILKKENWEIDNWLLKQIYEEFVKTYSYSNVALTIFKNNLENNQNNIKIIEKYFNLYYVYSYKKWVCISLVDLFSLILDLNNINYEYKIWKFKNNWKIYHILLKINNKYYDLTNDVYNFKFTKKINYFWLNKKQVEKYMTLLNIDRFKQLLNFK